MFQVKFEVKFQIIVSDVNIYTNSLRVYNHEGTEKLYSDFLSSGLLVLSAVLIH